MAYCVCVVLLFAAPAAEGATKRTVKSELTRLAGAGQITAAERDERLSAFNATKRAAKRLPRGTTRRAELTGVVSIVEGIARRRRLTGPRLVPLWLTLERNRAYWTTHTTGPATRRMSFAGSEVVWQYFPRQGLQFHPLANFARLNQLWAEHDDRMNSLLDELLTLAVPRAGGIAWEYYFAFGGGRPPWVSGLAQGTGIQSIARVAKRMGREDELYPVARSALGVFKTPTPDGVRVPTSDGAEYALYSFAPNLHVINGFVQALVGLYDLGRIAGDADAQALYVEGERVARRDAADVRHRRLVAVLARLRRARVRPLLPPAAARVPAQHVHAHRRPRLLRHRAALRAVRARGAGRLARHGDAARRHAGQGQGAAVEDLARRAEVLARRHASSRRSRPSWSATGRPR